MSASEVKVIEFTQEYARDFAALNYEWIEKGYTVEPHDRELLDDPQSYIIEPGGQVFIAVDGDGKAAGTVALVNIDDGSFELAKMAVAPDRRGQGISNLLMTACIDYARVHDKRFIILESNTKQTAAIALYRKFGFVELPLDPNSQFLRCNIRMQLILDDA